MSGSDEGLLNRWGRENSLQGQTREYFTLYLETIYSFGGLYIRGISVTGQRSAVMGQSHHPAFVERLGNECHIGTGKENRS